jgi:hypothetical protein
MTVGVPTKVVRSRRIGVSVEGTRSWPKGEVQLLASAGWERLLKARILRLLGWSLGKTRWIADGTIALTLSVPSCCGKAYSVQDTHTPTSGGAQHVCVSSGCWKGAE